METGPIETVLAGNKPPWRPKVSGYVALILGPMAGAFRGLRQLPQHGSAAKGAADCVLHAIALHRLPNSFHPLGIPADAPIKKIIALAVEGAGYSVFPSVLREDYVKWKTTNPGLKPRNDYASIGWGLLGALTYLAMAALIIAFQR